jgi:hypothetical protein
MASSQCLRMQWSVVPGAAKFLQALNPYTAIMAPLRISEDFANVKTLSREEQEKRLRELDARGETMAAVYMARRLYGYGLSEAEVFMEGLRSRNSGGRLKEKECSSDTSQ